MVLVVRIRLREERSARPGRTAPGWAAAIPALIEASALHPRDITLSSDDPKPPSPDVAELLRGRKPS